MFISIERIDVFRVFQCLLHELLIVGQSVYDIVPNSLFILFFACLFLGLAFALLRHQFLFIDFALQLDGFVIVNIYINIVVRSLEPGTTLIFIFRVRLRLCCALFGFLLLRLLCPLPLFVRSSLRLLVSYRAVIPGAVFFVFFFDIILIRFLLLIVITIVVVRIVISIIVISPVGAGIAVLVLLVAISVEVVQEELVLCLPVSWVIAFMFFVILLIIFEGVVCGAHGIVVVSLAVGRVS